MTSVANLKPRSVTKSSYRHILKYTSLFGSVQGLNILIGIIRTKCIALLLGPTGVGLISIYNSATALLQSATNLGIQTSGVREIAHAYNQGDGEAVYRNIRVLRTWSLVVAILGAAVTIAFHRPLSRWLFHSDEYTPYFVWLAPIVAMAAITCGEIAVLKGTRHLKDIANYSVISVVGALLTSVPLYWEWGFNAIIPSLLLIAILQLVVIMLLSYRHYPLQLSFRELREGKTMLLVGISIVLASIFGSAADLIIKAYLSDISISTAGLYNTGYMIVMTYAGLVFASLETDYFPHLSGVCHAPDKMSVAVNRQIDVSIVLLAPLLILMMVGMPIIVPLLFSSEFSAVIPMAQVALLAMYFRAINLAISYIMLARGDSKPYIILELLSYAVLVASVVLGYYCSGLLGTGYAIAIASFIECVTLIAFAAWRYRLTLNRTLLRFVAIQLAIGLATLVATTLLHTWLYWIVGAVALAGSTTLSLRNFLRNSKETLILYYDPNTKP